MLSVKKETWTCQLSCEKDSIEIHWMSNVYGFLQKQWEMKPKFTDVLVVLVEILLANS